MIFLLPWIYRDVSESPLCVCAPYQSGGSKFLVASQKFGEVSKFVFILFTFCQLLVHHITLHHYIMNYVYLTAIVLISVIVLSVIFLPKTSSPQIDIAEGRSVRCGTGMIYRYTGGQLRYYPSPPIAASWNPTWSQDILALSAEECLTIPKGKDMSMR